METKDWLTLLAGWFLGLLSPVVSGFIERRVRAPKLELKVDDSGVCCYRAKYLVPGVDRTLVFEALYFRVAVTNRRGRTANNCRAFLVGVSRRDKSDAVIPIYCDTLPLTWSYRDASLADQGVAIPTGTTHCFDVVAGMQQTGDVLRIQAPLLPIRYHDLIKDSGVYSFDVIVTADDVPLRRANLNIAFEGRWDSARFVDIG